MFSKTITAIAGLGLLAIAPAQAQSERAAAPVSIMFPALDEYLALDEDQRSHFTIRYILSSFSGETTDFDVWIETDDGRAPIERSAEDIVDIDTVAPFLQSDPVVMTTLPEGDGNLTVKLVPQLDLTREISMEDICLSLEQGREALSGSDGIMAELSPTLKGVGFLLEPGTDVRLAGGDLSEESLPSEQGDVWIEPSADMCDSGGAMVFSKPPLDQDFSQ
ncbi:hypothetical protein [Henriciella marina]|uniref:hypothetical protein n=1 Tax=Henriciella marina TaxID=453851 RepID=UPI00036929A0|nr:hypothetical protein [Henriciella marina]